MGTDPASQRVRQLRPHARSREPVRDWRADAADRRLHQRHADVRGGVDAFRRQDLRGHVNRATRRPDFRARLQPQGDHRRDRRRAARRLDRRRDFESSRRAGPRSRERGRHRNAGAQPPRPTPRARTTIARSSPSSRQRDVALVCLAGFMRLLSPVFVRRVSQSHSQHSSVAAAEIPWPPPAATGPGRRRHRERRHCSFCEQGSRRRSDRTCSSRFR